MELKDLVGVHMLDAVDYGSVEVVSRYGGDEKEFVNVLRFRLDNVTYVCEENPDDGYRSSMRDLRIKAPETPDIKNCFGYIVVNCKYVSLDKDRVANEDIGWDNTGADILEIYDHENGKLILAVGTSSTDSYYPSFVANWNPKNLHINKGVEDGAT